MILPLVSICCLCYNHEPYIRECLDGFMLQKTNFVFEVLIHDDASTDKSADIIREYEAKYPHIIKPIYQIENQYSKGIGVTRIYQFPRAKGKYIAMCEGDDYWTDPYKLQKQVDFLEANEEYSICFHKAKVFNQNALEYVFEQPDVNHNSVFSLNDFLQNNPIATASVVFRSDCIRTIPDWFSKVPFGDYALYLLILDRSKKNVMYFSDIMSVYRLHNGGVHGSSHFSNMGYANAYKQHVKFWNIIKANMLFEYRSTINKSIVNANMHIIDYLLADSKYRVAFVWNTLFLFKTKFKSYKTNLKYYLKISRCFYKSINITF